MQQLLGILARNIDSDKKDLADQKISPISIVVCNLYPFEETISKSDCTLPAAIEEIDIGGVTLLRAAAKNHERVNILTDPKDYEGFLKSWVETKGQTDVKVRRELALKAFESTAAYDTAISDYFRTQYASADLPPDTISSPIQRIPLRYGANPHQKPAQAFVQSGELPFKGIFSSLIFLYCVLQFFKTLAFTTALCGAPGYINLLDALNSYALVKELSEALNLPAAASFKHVSPAGSAVGIELNEIEKHVYGVDDLKEPLTPLACAYARARGTSNPRCQ